MSSVTAITAAAIARLWINSCRRGLPIITVAAAQPDSISVSIALDH